MLQLQRMPPHLKWRLPRRRGHSHGHNHVSRRKHRPQGTPQSLRAPRLQPRREGLVLVRICLHAPTQNIGRLCRGTERRRKLPRTCVQRPQRALSAAACIHVVVVTCRSCLLRPLHDSQQVVAVVHALPSPRRRRHRPRRPHMPTPTRELSSQQRPRGRPLACAPAGQRKRPHKAGQGGGIVSTRVLLSMFVPCTPRRPARPPTPAFATRGPCFPAQHRFPQLPRLTQRRSF